MGMIYIMLIVSLCLAIFFLVFFLWAAKSGQYDDDYSPSVRILFEDEIKSDYTNQNNDGNTNS
jgi:cbb3-type cytochrome oxidase maturation protein